MIQTNIQIWLISIIHSPMLMASALVRLVHNWLHSLSLPPLVSQTISIWRRYSVFLKLNNNAHHREQCDRIEKHASIFHKIRNFKHLMVFRTPYSSKIIISVSLDINHSSTKYQLVCNFLENRVYLFPILCNTQWANSLFLVLVCNS